MYKKQALLSNVYWFRNISTRKLNNDHLYVHGYFSSHKGVPKINHIQALQPDLYFWLHVLVSPAQQGQPA